MKKLPLLLSLLVGLAPAWASSPPLKVQERRLANGLRVLVHEDHDIPNVALYTAWSVGSRNEVPGITGLAHFFEHMMFVGGARFGSRFDPTMEAAGGSNNAYTTRDQTVYQDWFPAGKLELVLEMEADRMAAMVFDPEVVESERGVVASERRSAMDEPEAVMAEQLWAAAFIAHPYQWPVLGWMVDIENWRKSDLEDFFRTHYAPGSATLVLSGDVDAEEAFRLVEKHMGKIPAGPERRPVHTREPEQIGERRLVVKHESASLPRVTMAWHIPETSHPDFPALDVLERLLLHGDSSRLQHLLVEEAELALGVGGGWQGLQFDPGLFTVDVGLRQGKSPAEVERRVYATLAALATEGPRASELAKAKKSLRADLVRRMKTIDGKASLIADTDAFYGGWQNLGNRMSALEAVTVEDVRRVLGTYFRDELRTVCTLEVTP